MEVNITRSNPVNLLLLQSELKALIGDNFKGIATEPGIVRIILGDEVAGSVADSITLSVLQHDENAMTDYQAAIANAQTQVSETKANAKLVLDAYDTTISNAVGNWVNLDPTTESWTRLLTWF